MLDGGYESLLWVREAGCTYGQLNGSQLSRLGSRGKAARALATHLQTIFEPSLRISAKCRAAIDHFNGTHRCRRSLLHITLTTSQRESPKGAHSLHIHQRDV